MMEQLLCHLIGDYWLQNDWMALNKKKKWWVALIHAVVYTLPFLLLTINPFALAAICLTHAIIDGTLLVEKLNEIKNYGCNGDGIQYYMRSVIYRRDDIYSTMWHWKKDERLEPGGILGFVPDRPAWICWLLHIVQDNTLHLLCNYLALKYLILL